MRTARPRRVRGEGTKPPASDALSTMQLFATAKPLTPRGGNASFSARRKSGKLARYPLVAILRHRARRRNTTTSRATRRDPSSPEYRGRVRAGQLGSGFRPHRLKPTTQTQGTGPACTPQTYARRLGALAQVSVRWPVSLFPLNLSIRSTAVRITQNHSPQLAEWNAPTTDTERWKRASQLL
jgi:hypothetical protein